MNNLTKLDLIRERVEKLDKIHQLEILKIFIDNDIKYTENKNGTFINITNIKPKIISLIDDYLNYVYKQNIDLKKTEKIKENYKKNYFKKENKETTLTI